MIFDHSKDETLCSRRDPKREASQWVELQTVSNEHFWVLGLGEGYHIQALVKKYPEHIVSVVDHREDLARLFQENFPDCRSSVRIEIVSSEQDLLETRSFALFGFNFSSIHQFRPAVLKNRDLYDGFSKALRGQTKVSFAYFSRQLDIEINDGDFSKITEFQIKEIAAALEHTGNSRARRWVRVLRELVA